MKRTFPANIDGQIFYIDEDAFELLRNYLDQLRAVFRGSEGQDFRLYRRKPLVGVRHC